MKNHDHKKIKKSLQRLRRAEIEEIEIGDTVFYVPKHLDPIFENAEIGKVSSLNENSVWVRYNSQNGELTPIDRIFVKN